MIRRRKADVETELPSRTDRNHFVSMAPSQREAYRDHETNVARILHAAKRRPLTKREQDKLMRELAMMRMVCDTPYILDPEDRTCPKLKELESVLDELCSDPDVKIVIFSEWVRMLELVRELLDKKLKLGYALHTGSVPQRRRRAEIQRFKQDPDCRVFVSSDSGGVGLNLQNASVVVNCDLPWNPAKLEQRIARVWRKHQMRNVTVVNLISEDSIEQRMLDTLAAKRSLADGVLDGVGDVKEVPLKKGPQAFMQRLNQVMETPAQRKKEGPPKAETLPADRSTGFAARASELLGGSLVACEERYPEHGVHSVILVVVDREARTWRARLESVHEELFGRDKIDPLAPVQLQVIDRSTFDALQQLSEAGLVQTTIRATRHLYPAPGQEAGELTDEEQQKTADLRKKAGRKLKMARVLSLEQLDEEAREALLGALPLLGQALAVEHRLPEPRDAHEALHGPPAPLWGQALDRLREFLEQPEAPVLATIKALEGAGLN